MRYGGVLDPTARGGEGPGPMIITHCPLPSCTPCCAQTPLTHRTGTAPTAPCASLIPLQRPTPHPQSFISTTHGIVMVTGVAVPTVALARPLVTDIGQPFADRRVFTRRVGTFSGHTITTTTITAASVTRSCGLLRLGVCMRHIIINDLKGDKQRRAILGAECKALVQYNAVDTIHVYKYIYVYIYVYICMDTHIIHYTSAHTHTCI